MTTAPGLSLPALTAPFCPQCVPSGQHTPSETFKIADSHPEVEERVEPLSPSRSPLFHNKHRYQKIGVHEVAAADGQRYNVLYLATGATGHTARRRERRGGDRSPPGAGAAFPAWHMLGRQAGAAKRREQLPAWLRGHSRAPGSIPGTGEGGTARPTGGAEILSKRSGSVVSRRFAELCSPLRLLRAGICSPALVEGLAGV